MRSPLAWWRARRARRRHQITDYASAFGGYLCSCGKPWLVFGNRCMTQPSGKEPSRG